MALAHRLALDIRRTTRALDSAVGSLIDALDENGRAPDTLVVYTSDQGALVGEHGWRDKRYMMEESIRVPFIVRYPNRIAAGTRIVRTTRTVDIAATFLDYAQLPLPREMQGRSWRRLVHSGDDSWDDRLYYRYWCTPGNGIVVGQEECTLWRPAHWGMRTPTHKVIFYDGAWPACANRTSGCVELFDLGRDPLERHNQALKEPALTRELLTEAMKLRTSLDDTDGPNLAAVDAMLRTGDVEPWPSMRDPRLAAYMGRLRALRRPSSRRLHRLGRNLTRLDGDGDPLLANVRKTPSFRKTPFRDEDTVREKRGLVQSTKPPSTVAWDVLPAHCNATAGCCVEELRYPSNFRPVTWTTNFDGEVLGVQYPQFWQQDAWDDGTSQGEPLREQSTRTQLISRGGEPEVRGSSLVKIARAVRLSPAILTRDGFLLDAGQEHSFTTNEAACSLWPNRLTAASGRESPQREDYEVLVIRQTYSGAFQHLFFQTFPQLVMMLQAREQMARRGCALAMPDRASLRVVLGDGTESTANQLIAELLNLQSIKQTRKLHVRAATLLRLMPGNCPNAACYPHGIIRAVHATAMGLVMNAQQQPPPRDRIIYLRRTGSRRILNEGELQAAVKDALLPPYQIVTRADGMPLKQVRELMARARVVYGPHGGAWGNAFFAAAAPEVVFIELNRLHGRECYVFQHHYVGAPSRYWTLEPENMTSLPRPIRNFYNGNMGWRVNVLHVVEILVRAGVATCKRPPPQRQPGPWHVCERPLVVPEPASSTPSAASRRWQDGTIRQSARVRSTSNK